MPWAFRIATLCSCLVSVAGCYAPEIGACQVTCAQAGGECPEGTSCSGGFCNPPGVEASTCSGAGDAGPIDVPEGMVLIPDDGAFFMGCSPADQNCDDNENPRHLVRLDSYLIDLTEVTSAAYAECVDAEVCAPLTADDTSNYDPVLHGEWPVTGMNRQTARAYCEWMDKKLPTEAQWEKAARGGAADQVFPWGNEPPGCYDRAQYRLNVGCEERLELADVGSFAANGYGLHDMSGNVWEWVSDWNGPYAEGEVRNPSGPSEEPAVAETGILRGAGYLTSFVNSLRSANRYFIPHTAKSRTYGMRCVKELP